MPETLINPPSWLSRQSNGVKAIIVCSALVLILLAILFGVSKVDHYFADRKTKQLRENVNIAVAAANTQAAVVANDRVDEAVAVEKVKQAANDVITASNATDEAKQAANAAVANYVAAKNANVSTSTTEADLDAKLKALGE